MKAVIAIATRFARVYYFCYYPITTDSRIDDPMTDVGYVRSVFMSYIMRDSGGAKEILRYSKYTWSHSKDGAGHNIQNTTPRTLPERKSPSNSRCASCGNIFLLVRNGIFLLWPLLHPRKRPTATTSSLEDKTLVSISHSLLPTVGIVLL